jgi:hypothetical protein
VLGATTVQVFGCVDREIYIDMKEGRKDRYSGPGAWWQWWRRSEIHFETVVVALRVCVDGSVCVERRVGSRSGGGTLLV